MDGSPAQLGTFKVKVGSELIQIRTDQPSQVVEKVAGYLNGKIQEAGRAAVGADNFRLMVLAALNVAGEVFELQTKLEEHDQIRHRMLDQAHSLTDQLERAIATSR
jgi:cell division protein ZapA (FtsZ GTPase activity inhibitor)